MYTLLRTAVVIASAAAVWAQPAPYRYAQIDYMKVEPGKVSEYVRMEREVYKAIHEARVKRGNILSWSLWAVRIPGGSAQPYGFATSTTFEKFEALESPMTAGLKLEEIHPNLKPADLFERSRTTRDLVRSDVLQLIASTDGEPKSRKYASIQFHKAVPGKGGEYVRALRENWKPLHDEMVKAGKIAGWAAFAVRYPGGSRRPHDFITVLFHESFASVENPYMGADAAKAQEAAARSAGARDTVRTELWTLLERVSK